MQKAIVCVVFLQSLGFCGAPIVVPASTSVYVAGTIQFTSTDVVTWSLVAGSTGSISSTGTYTAPLSFQAKNVMAGCPALPNDHIYNTDISSLPVDSNSAARMATIGTSSVVKFEVSFPLNVMTNATPTDTMAFRYTTDYDGQSFPIVAGPYRGVEHCLYPNDYFAQDRHQLGVNTDTCQFYEIYNYYPVGTNNIECPTCNAQSGIQYGG